MKDFTFPQLFPVDGKSPQCFRKKDILKTNKSIKDFNWCTPPSSPASTDGEQDTKKSLTEPCAELRPRRWSNKPFTKLFFFKIPDLVHRAAPAAIVGENRR
jgi:hypothetical protein